MNLIVLSEDTLKGILQQERETLLKELGEYFKSPKIDRKLNAKEAASFLGIALSTLYKRVKEVPHKKFGKKLVFSTFDLEKLNVLF